MVTIRQAHVYELTRLASNYTGGCVGDAVGALVMAALVLTTVAKRSGAVTVDNSELTPADLVSGMLDEVDTSLADAVREIVALIEENSIMLDGQLAPGSETVQ